MPFALYTQDEVVGTEDATVAQTADLTRGGELYQTRGVDAGTIDIDTDCDALLARNDITIRGTDVPDAPGNAFEDFWGRGFRGRGFRGTRNEERGRILLRGVRREEGGVWRGLAHETGALGHKA